MSKRRKSFVRSKALQKITFESNSHFFYQRNHDIDALMKWPDWNPSQARLLLKMKYDIELIFAAIKRTRDRHLDMRSLARKEAFDFEFITRYQIPAITLDEIEKEEVRAYHPKFIRKRLTLPNDLEQYPKNPNPPLNPYYIDKRKDDGNALSTIAPIYPATQTRYQTLMKWGKQRFECLEERDKQRAELRAYLERWNGEGRKESKKSIMRKFKIGPAEFYSVYNEMESAD